MTMNHLLNKRPTSVFLHGGGFPAFWYTLGYAYEIYYNYKSYNKTVMSKTNMTFSNLKTENIRIGGYSAGALAAAVIACFKHKYDNHSFPIQWLLSTCKNVSYLCTLGNISKAVDEMMENILPLNAHLIAEANQLELIVCDPNDSYNIKVFKKWSTRIELIKCIVASAHIPYISGGFYADNEFKYIDGTFCKDLYNNINNNYDIIIEHAYSCGPIENMQCIDEETALRKFEQGKFDAMKMMLF
jgi:hypothetical protein